MQFFRNIQDPKRMIPFQFFFYTLWTFLIRHPQGRISILLNTFMHPKGWNLVVFSTILQFSSNTISKKVYTKSYKRNIFILTAKEQYLGQCMSVKLEYFLHINFPNRLQNIFVKMSSFFSLLRLFPVTAFTTIHALFNFFQLRAVLHFLCAMHCGKIVCTKQKTQKRILHTDFDFFILHFFF